MRGMGLVMPRSLNVVRVGFHKSQVSKPLGVRGVLGPALISVIYPTMDGPPGASLSFEASMAPVYWRVALYLFLSMEVMLYSSTKSCFSAVCWVEGRWKIGIF